MPPSSTRFLALILTCALVACGDRVPSGSITNLDGGIPSTLDDGIDGSTPLSSISGIKVTSSPENEHTARATLGKFGGSVAATGSDGTRYELRVPPLALAMATQIAITPLHIDVPKVSRARSSTPCDSSLRGSSSPSPRSHHHTSAGRRRKDAERPGGEFW